MDGRDTLTRTGFARACIASTLGALALVLVLAFALTRPPSAAAAAAPAPCAGVTQISDATGDGHHAQSDLLAGWFSESAGRLQAVLRINAASWEAVHDDEQVNGAGTAMLFDVGGTTWYVRVVAQLPGQGALAYDYGTWTPAGNFASQGTTTGEVAYGTGGTVTLDLPAAVGAVVGTRLTNVFALTYDGSSAGVPHWVDRAPGGTGPAEASFGADYVVGSCGTGGTPPPGGTATTTAVVLTAPARVVGGGVVRITGRVVPARGGVAVAIARRTGTSSVRGVVHTAADGSFAARVPVHESTTLRASAQGIASQSRTIAVASTVRISIRGAADGPVVVTGRVSPALPGKLLLLASDDIDASATAYLRTGSTFAMRLPRLAAGAYQVVFIPAPGRADRSTSNVGKVRP